VTNIGDGPVSFRRRARARPGPWRPVLQGLTMLAYSPTLSIATAAFELTAAAWVLRAQGRREVLRTVAATLVFLAGYQLLEVFVCHAPHETLWGRAAFADVVWLPPLGWLLLLQLSRSLRLSQGWRQATWVAFGLAGFFSIWSFVDPDFVTGTVCQTVFATYAQPSSAFVFYGAFYHLGLWGIIFGGLALLRRLQDPLDRAHVADFVTGNAAFVVFALTTEIVYAPSADATPSIMCHYALILAVFLTRLAWREHRAAAPSRSNDYASA